MCICVCRVGKENMKTRRCQREVKERNMRGEKGIIMGKREGKLGRMRGQDRKRTVARMDEREIKKWEERESWDVAGESQRDLERRQDNRRVRG